MKRNRINTTVVILAIMIGLSLKSLYVEASNYYTEGYFQYYEQDDEIVIYKYFGKEEKVVIPESIANLPVCNIHENAFDEAKTVRTLRIPYTVKEVGKDALTRMKSLSIVFLESNLLSLKVREGVQIIEQFQEYVNPDEYENMGEGEETDLSNPPAQNSNDSNHQVGLEEPEETQKPNTQIIVDENSGIEMDGETISNELEDNSNEIESQQSETNTTDSHKNQDTNETTMSTNKKNKRILQCSVLGGVIVAFGVTGFYFSKRKRK